METIFYLLGAATLAHSIQLLFWTNPAIDSLLKRSVWLAVAAKDRPPVTAKGFLNMWAGSILSVVWLTLGLISSQWFYFLIYNLLFFLLERVFGSKLFSEDRHDSSIDDLRGRIAKLLYFVGASRLAFTIFVLINYTWIKFDLWQMIVIKILY
ncbi:MAG: hypothetical protein ACTHMM_11955 [Agriterribacter sp.]